MTVLQATARQAPSLRAAISRAADLLADAGVASPRSDAENIACHLMGVERGELWAFLDQTVPVAFDDLIARRAERIPLQHLTGVTHFRTVSLMVGPGVFIPRPETEVVVGHVLKHLDDLDAPCVVDLFAGSGAIGAAVKAEHPSARVHAVECEAGAIPWLQHNAERHGVTVHVEDVAHCLDGFDSSVDVVIANPPYIPSDAVPRDPEVARFDPPAALYSGADGLNHIRMVERAAARLLRPGGLVAVEHGDQQGRSAAAVFGNRARWDAVTDHRDLTGRDRFVTARAMRPQSVTTQAGR